MTTLDHSQPTLDATQVARAKGKILELRRQAYSAEYCAGQVGIARRTLYLWTEQDPEFARAWHDANESRLDWHEDVLRDCASKGLFVPSLAILKSAGRIVDRSPPPGGTTINLYQVFQQILTLQPQLPPEHQAEPSQQLESAPPQLQGEHLHSQGQGQGQQTLPPQLEDGTTQAAPRGRPSAKSASRRRPERNPLPR